jgi:predicted MFS family arabinose efflux permease
MTAEESRSASPIPGAPPLAPKGWGKTFRAFSYRDYRLLWTGAFISSSGTWMQEVAQNWLILTMTGSASLLLIDAFLGEVPFLLFSLLGGVVADRFDRRKILLASQCVQLTNAFLLGGLVYFHRVQIWEIFALSFLTGFAQSFGGPAYQSLVPTLVAKEDVPNAVALQSIQFNLARVIGPILAGITFAAFGAAACFGINGLSFFVVIAAILALRIRRVAGPHAPASVLHSLKEGLSFVRRNRVLLSLICLSFAGSFLAFPLTTFIAVYAKQIFLLDAKGYGRLLSCFGVGAVIGALGVATFGNFRHKAIVAILGLLGFGGLVISFALSRSVLFSGVLLFFAGAALVIVFAILTSLIQLLVHDEMRGRVVSVYMLAFRGAMPLGNLFASFVVAHASVKLDLVFNGVAMAAIAISVLLFRGRELARV